jgi:DNA-binding NarL/FixJ family response regulator
MTSQDSRPCVVLFDELSLRRVAYCRLLEPWLSEQSFNVLSFGFQDDGSLGAVRSPVLQILILGSSRVDDPTFRSRLAARRRQWPEAPIVVVSDNAERGEMTAAYRYGVQGFFPSILDPDVAFRALALILAGGTFFPPEMLNGGARPVAAERGRGPSLTPRQLDVLALLREGKSNKLIARDLSMCESTVKVHVRQIMRKLGAANRTQAALTALPPIDIAPAENPAPDIRVDLRGRESGSSRDRDSSGSAAQSARAR